MTNRNILSIYRFICWSATFSFSIFWIYKYILNEDLCSIDFKYYFEDKQSVSPMLSLCIKNPFSEEKLRVHDPYLNTTSYVNFLKGEEFNSSWLNIDYHDLIKNISEYVEPDAVRFRNGSGIYLHPEYGWSPSYEKSKFLAYMKSFNNLAVYKEFRFYNCYALSIPHDKSIQEFYFRVNSNIFTAGVREERYSLMTILHYPNQMLYSTHTLKYAWPQNRDKNESYIMRFKIKGVELVRRRQKKNSPCNENWEDYDYEIIENHIQKVGCRPLYLSSTSNVHHAPVCSTKEQMKNAVFNLRTDEYGVLTPCTSMEEISYEFEESTLDPKNSDWGKEGTFWIGLFFYNSHYKDIFQIRYKLNKTLIRSVEYF